MPWVLFFGGLWLLLAFHIGLLALGSHWAKMEPEAIVFGIGPPLLTRKVGGLELRLCALPLGGSVPMKLEDVSVAQRLVPVALAGVLTTAVGVVLLGVAPSLEVARDALVLLFTGAVSPGVDAQQTLGRIVNAVSTGNPVETFAASAVAVGVFNLVLGTVVAVSTIHRALAAVVSLVTILLGLPWIYAWVVYLF